MKSLYLIISAAGISIILFLTLLLAGRNENQGANRKLQALLLCLVPFLLSLQLAFDPEYPWVQVYTAGNALAYLLLGPLLYDYAWGFFYPQVPPSGFLRKQYLPAGLGLVFLLVAGLLFPPNSFFVVTIAITLLGVGLLVIYLLRFRSLQRGLRVQLKEQLARIAHLDLRWIRLWGWGVLLMLLLDFFSVTLVLLTNNPWVFLINALYYLFMVTYLGYYGITQQALFVKLAPPKPKPALADQSLPFDCQHSDFVQLKNGLVHLFESDQYHTQEGVSLGGMATALETTDKKLSFLLNQCMDTNFYDLVNAYRMQDFLARIDAGEAKHQTLLAVAFDAGFNSKATFNRVFKEKKGMTPAQYLKSLEQPV